MADRDYELLSEEHGKVLQEKEKLLREINILKVKEKYLKEAIKGDHEGIFCHFCGDVNTFVDDLGWFWICDYIDGDNNSKEQYPVCERCWNGKPGQAHVERHGLGDR